MRRETTKPLAILLGLATALSACKKDSDTEPTPTPTPTEVSHHATIRLSLMFMKDTNAYALDTVLHDSLGHALKLTTMRFYIGGGHAVNDEDEEVGHFEESILLVDADSAMNDFLLGPIYTSHIHEFHMDLGLDSAVNHTDISGATAPLNDAGMYLGSATAGRIFVKVVGNADLNGDGTFEQPISFTCSGDELLNEAHIHVHHDIVEGETFTGEGTVDMALLFEGIDVATTATGTGSDPVCTRLVSNLSGAIMGMEE